MCFDIKIYIVYWPLDFPHHPWISRILTDAIQLRQDQWPRLQSQPGVARFLPCPEETNGKIPQSNFVSIAITFHEPPIQVPSKVMKIHRHPVKIGSNPPTTLTLWWWKRGFAMGSGASSSLADATSQQLSAVVAELSLEQRRKLRSAVEILEALELGRSDDLGLGISKGFLYIWWDFYFNHCGIISIWLKHTICGICLEGFHQK